jgi:hypothetical protein
MTLWLSSCVRSILNHQLGRLKIAIPIILLCNNISQKGEFWEVGVRDRQSTDSFFFFYFVGEQVLYSG